MTVRAQIAWLVDRFERGHSNDPTDRGGETFHGVTLTAYRDVNPRATLEDLRRAITSLPAAHSFFEVWLCGKHRLDEVADPALRLAVLDYAINSGPRTAIKALQRGAGVTADGVFGPQTAAAVNHARDPRTLRDGLLAARLRLLAKTPEIRSVKRGGWFNRIADLLEATAS